LPRRIDPARPVERLPALLAGPWVAEAARGEEGGSLRGDTWSLADYDEAVALAVAIGEAIKY
jgi:hypothetical protein